MNTNKKILKVAGKLFGEQGYFGTSMSDIAREVGIVKSALYYHFDSKEKLFRELMKTSCQNLKKELKHSVKSSITPIDVVFNIVKTLLDYRIKHPEIRLLTSVSISSNEKEPLTRFIVKMRVSILKIIREIIGDLDFTRKKGRRFVYVFSASILGFIFSPLVPKNMDSEELSEQLTKTLLNSKDQKSYA